MTMIISLSASSKIFGMDGRKERKKEKQRKSVTGPLRTWA